MSPLPPKMYVTTDAVTFSLSAQGGLQVLLIRRANDPYQGQWALPGGFVEEDEDLPDACARELEEETGVRPAGLIQIGAWGAPGRDPRGRNVSVAYLAVVGPDQKRAAAGSDAAGARWFPVEDLPEPGFDHVDILATGRGKLRLVALGTHMAFGLLPVRFRLRDLREALRACLSRPVSFEQTAVLAECADIVLEKEGTDEQPGVYRCRVDDLTAPLREG